MTPREQFEKNEKRLETLARLGIYCHAEDHLWPKLYPEAATLEKEQDALMELI